MARIDRKGVTRPCIATRVRGDLKERLEQSATENARSIGGEVEARLIASYEITRNGIQERKMDAFWAYFDGLCDAQQPESNEAVLLELIRHRLEIATGFRVALTPPEKPKLVASA